MMQHADTGGLKRADTDGLQRTTTGDFQKGGTGDIQNTAQDIQGGQGPVFCDGNYPVLGFGFCATRGRRPYNEDRVMLSPRMNGQSNLNYYGVLDGHAGARASEFAKNDLPGRLGRKLEGRGPLSQQEGESFFHQIFCECDQAWLQQAKAANMEDGTTACTILVSGADLFCINVGDSEAIICQVSGGAPKGLKISKTHKPSDATEAARIRNLGGQVDKLNGVYRVNKNLSVSRAIGDAPLKQFVIPDPSVTYCKLTKDDQYLVIGSDGLWDFMGPHTAATMVHRAGDAQQAARILVDAALSAGTTDNCGVVVVDLRHIWEHDPPPPPPVQGCCVVS